MAIKGVLCDLVRYVIGDLLHPPLNSTKMLQFGVGLSPWKGHLYEASEVGIILTEEIS
jgi:hypothetical protein